MDKVTIAIVVVFSIIFLSYRFNEYKKKQDIKNNTTWPVDFPACPDYWVQDGTKCINKYNLGRRHYGESAGSFPERNQAIDFGVDEFQGKDGPINKCRWAKRHNVSWEGIDNLSGCH